MISALLFLVAQAGDHPAPMVNCYVRHADCDIEIAAIEEAIHRDPELGTLRQRIDDRLAFLKTRMTNDAAKALADDELRHRKSLRRDLFATPDHRSVDADAKMGLLLRLTRRHALLQRITTAPRTFPGLWANASGQIRIEQIGPGRYSVEADPVELDFLKWTCELEGTGSERLGLLSVDIGGGERLELRIQDGLLRSVHVYPDFSRFCGANGHAGGEWFPLEPAPNQPGE